MMKRLLIADVVKNHKPGTGNSRWSILLSHSLLLLLLSIPALAANPDVCQQYAQNALAQLQQEKP